MESKEPYRGKIAKKKINVAKLHSLAVGFKYLSLTVSLPRRLQWKTAMFAHTQTVRWGRGKRQAFFTTWATQTLQIEA